MPDPTFETIQYAVDGPVATITLDRPKAANAQNSQLIYELDAVAIAHAVLVVDGTPREQATGGLGDSCAVVGVRRGEPVKPLKLFLQSNNYLAVVFCALAIDSAFSLPTIFH